MIPYLSSSSLEDELLDDSDKSAVALGTVDDEADVGGGGLAGDAPNGVPVPDPAVLGLAPELKRCGELDRLRLLGVGTVIKIK